jgi:hypothetical protein
MTKKSLGKGLQSGANLLKLKRACRVILLGDAAGTRRTTAGGHIW